MADNDVERFHVMFAADDIKELTLDQLDDAYRLDIIDDSTMIWQEGFEGWKTLAVVLAGDDDDDAEEAEPIEDVSDWADVAGGQHKPQAANPQFAQLTASTHYPSAAPAQVAPSQRPVASQYPAQTSQYPAQSQYPASGQSVPRADQSVPGTARAEPVPDPSPRAELCAGGEPVRSGKPVSGRPAEPAPRRQPVPSGEPLSDPEPIPGCQSVPVRAELGRVHGPAQHARAVSFDPTLDEPKPASPWFRRVLLVAAAAGALLVAQRAGLVYSFAKSVDQGKSAEQLEAKVLGSPAVDTPRGLDAKLEDIQNRYQLDKLSYTEPVVAKPDAPSSASAADTTVSAAKPESGSATTPAAAAAAAAAPAKAQDAISDRMQNALSGKPAPKPAPAARPAARPSGGKGNSKLGVGTNGGDPNDPMNGKL